MPKISIVCPVYSMSHAWDMLKRNLDSIMSQSFTDYEIVVSDNSADDQLHINLMRYPFPDSKFKYIKNRERLGMANNTNNAIDNASGELIKILYQDDYFYDDNSLEDIIKNFKDSDTWLVTGCAHEKNGIVGNFHRPFFTRSENNIGSPSVLTFRRSVPLRFNPELYWTLDLKFYRDLFDMYGKPKIVETINVVIGLGDHQSTHLLSDERKRIEEAMMK